MANRKSPPPSGLTPGKAVLIGVLSIVLLVVIVIQFGGGGKKTTSRSRSPSRNRAAAEPAAFAPQTSPPSTAKRSERRWPTFDVHSVAAHNPFSLPAELAPEPEIAETLTPEIQTGEAASTLATAKLAAAVDLRRRQSEFMASLRAQGVDMILRSPRGSIARVGERNFRVGDIHEGLRVDAINKDGIVFVPIGETELEEK